MSKDKKEQVKPVNEAEEAARKMTEDGSIFEPPPGEASQQEPKQEVQPEVIHEPVPEPPPNEQKQGKELAKRQTEVLVGSNGMLAPRSIDEMWRMANAFWKSGMLPKHYDKPEKVLTGMQYAAELGLKPLTGMKQICIINGSPSVWGEIPLGLVRKSGFLEYIAEYRIDEKGEKIQPNDVKSEVFGCVCVVKRKGDLEPYSTRFTKADADRAGLSKEKPIYKLYPHRMYQMRARSQALKDVFPDVLSGVSIAEYDYNVLPEKVVGDIESDGVELKEAVTQKQEIAQGLEKLEVKEVK